MGDSGGGGGKSSSRRRRRRRRRLSLVSLLANAFFYLQIFAIAFGHMEL